MPLPMITLLIQFDDRAIEFKRTLPDNLNSEFLVAQSVLAQLMQEATQWLGTQEDRSK